MVAKSITKDDYKKWLNYSFDASDPKKLFNLYKALDNTGNADGVSCKKAVYQDGVAICITCEETADDLLIKESAREEFKKYLVENYFRSENIDQWYVTKIDNAERNKNLASFTNEHSSTESPSPEIKPHPKELFYLKVRIAISALFYIGFIAAIILSFVITPATGLLLLLIIPFVLLAKLATTILKGIITGLIKGNSIQLSASQYPEIYSIIKEEAKKIGLKELPETYVMHGPFNGFVMSFARAKILCLFSGVIETALTGNYEVVRFVIAHELCHIKRKHLFKEKILFPSNFIPFLYKAYSRGCEFTCDRAGYTASPKGSIEGVLIMTAGKEIYKRFNVEQHIESANANANFWTWLSEKFLTHPHLYKRLTAIRDFSNYNK
jgi:Zn-dependent protease with chaperone function